ncbi:MAG: hypothetical protein WC091_24225 [Sulfuricellaceae bacterium]
MREFDFFWLHRENLSSLFSLATRVLLVLSALANVPAFAEEGLHLGGFGTLGYNYDNKPDIAPARDVSQLPKHNYATGPGWLVDSRVGVQFEYGVSPNIDLVGQVVLRDHFKADFDSSTELAYVSVKPQPQLDIRVGRINYDAFLMSDYRNVGYAYPWVRPPAEFYGLIPIFSVNGIDAAYNILTEDFLADDARWRIKVQAGSSRYSAPVGSGKDGGYDFTAENLVGLSVTRQTEFWRLKMAHSRFIVGNEVPAFAPLHQGLDSVAAAGVPAISAEAADLRKNISFKDAEIGYTTLGAAYDDGTWLAQGELGYASSTANVVPHGRMGYASLGRRLGEWMPFVMVSTSRPDNDVRYAANDWGAYNAIMRDPAFHILNTIRIEQNTVSIGARWDFSRNAALKLQWDRTDIKPSGYGLWWRNPAGTTSRVDLLSATLDFMF